METLVTDLRYALRALRGNVGFTTVAVLTLALGIGANAAVFDALDTLLVRPPALVRQPDRVVRLYFTVTYPGWGTNTSPVTSYGVYRALREGARAFSDLAAFHQGDLSVGRGLEAERAHGALVSHSYFPLLGVSPALGRTFTAEEDRLGADPVVVLGYGYWQRRFGGDPEILGRQLWLGRDPYTVIGVTPKGFTGVNLDNVDLWLPLVRANALVFGWDVLSDPASANGSYWLQIIGRQSDGVSAEAAAAEATGAFRRATAAVAPSGPFHDPNAIARLGPTQAARGPTPDRDATISTWLAAVAALVLFIACANAANLMLTRALRGRHDMAVRLALGGGRRALVRLLLVENSLLALAAGVLALLGTMWVGPLLRGFLLPALPPGSVLGTRVFGATVVATLAAGLLAGVVPAWQGSRVDLVATLKSEARAGERRSRLRTGLLVIQVALTLVLLTGAGLFVRSLRNVRALDLGLDTEHVLVGTMDLRMAGRSPQEINQLFLAMLDRLARLPDVERVAASVGHPFGSASGMQVRVPGRDSLPQVKTGGPYYSQVTAGYFEAIGTTIVRGRSFTPSDRPGSPRVAVISETMARLYFPGEDPLGRCVMLGDAPGCYEIVGVAKEARHFAAVEDSYLHVYIPLGQWDVEPITALFVRARGDPRLLIEPVRREMQALAPDLPFANVTPLGDLVDRTIRPWRLGATLFSGFGALGLVVAALGLYGVLSYTVAQRTREIGLRMALGAEAGSVLRLVVTDGIRATLAGLALGLVGAYAAGRAVGSLLYGLSPTDPATLVAVTVVLLVTAALASYMPARRAARVDPMEALRYE